jgi:hypothetical protein
MATSRAGRTAPAAPNRTADGGPDAAIRGLFEVRCIPDQVRHGYRYDLIDHRPARTPLLTPGTARLLTVIIRLLPMILAGILALVGGTRAAHGAPTIPEASECALGQAIEQTLGKHGYRVIMSGAYEESGERTVKIQMWENEDRDWVITEAFLYEQHTCVVRTGRRLHMLY